MALMKAPPGVESRHEVTLDTYLSSISGVEYHPITILASDGIRIYLTTNEALALAHELFDRVSERKIELERQAKRARETEEQTDAGHTERER